jgi:molybdopterin-guanine dinucleotide biosynthesis protein A
LHSAAAYLQKKRKKISAVYHHQVDGITAFVLAGGKSTRMGADKAFLDFAGRTLLDRALDKARDVAARVCIVGDAGKFARHGETFEDIYRNCGPLGGIQAALACSATDLNLILGVDLPFIEVAFLRYLLFRARATAATVTVPSVTGIFQPLCAVYGKGFAAVARHSLESGQNKIDRLFLTVPTEVLREEELTREGFAVEMFRNLNTPEELEQAKAQQFSRLAQ